MRNFETCDTVVVGAGLFGNIAAKALRAEGQRVITIDAKMDLRASPCAACLMKPGWFVNMTKADIDEALFLLNALYGVHDLPFQILGFSRTVHWVNPREVLYEPDLLGAVVDIKDTDDGYHVRVHGLNTQRTIYVIVATNVVVAAGIWTDSLVSLGGARMEGKAGAAFTYRGKLDKAIVQPWAPYKQIVAFNRDEDEIWIGDGSAIIPTNWTGARMQQSEERCRPYAQGAELVQRLSGIRPYAKTPDPCLMYEAMPRLWAVTGGAKNGTMAAAWAANQLIRRLT